MILRVTTINDYLAVIALDTTRENLNICNKKINALTEFDIIIAKNRKLIFLFLRKNV